MPLEADDEPAARARLPPDRRTRTAAPGRTPARAARSYPSMDPFQPDHDRRGEQREHLNELLEQPLGLGIADYDNVVRVDFRVGINPSADRREIIKRGHRPAVHRTEHDHIVEPGVLSGAL